MTASILSRLASAPAPKPVEKSNDKAKADWVNIDPTSLPPHLREALKSYQDAYAQASTQRRVYERLMTEAVDPIEGEKVIFGYSYGKLSMAIVVDKPKTSGRNAIDLAAFKARR